MYNVSIAHLILFNSNMTNWQTNELVVRTCKQWCKENVGVDKWNYYGEYKRHPFIFKFKDGQDALAFKMRFGIL